MASLNLESASKFLSYVLRHEPEAIGLVLDREGWADLDELVVKARASGKAIDRKMIEEVVASSEKKRFSISEDGCSIRAAQGHSTNTVAISYAAVEPPEVLYHGTATRFMASILSEGLKAGARQYVHLSGDVETALAVGRRHGKAVVLRVAAGEMFRKGGTFYRAENGVWLTEAVGRGLFRGRWVGRNLLGLWRDEGETR